MALSSFNYTKTYTGQSIASAVQSACQSIDPNTGGTGLIYWQTILKQFYDDFKSILKSSIETFMSNAQCLFPVGAAQPVVFPTMSFAQLDALYIATAQSIDSQIKSACQSLDPNLGTTGAILWGIVFDYLFQDIVSVLKSDITQSCNTATTNVPPQAMSPPHIGTTALVPATLDIQWVEASLEGLIQANFNTGTAQSLAQIIDGQIKSVCQNIDPNLGTTGPILLDVVCTNLEQKLQVDLHPQIQTFIICGQHFKIPEGDPGTNPAGIPTVLPTVGGLYGVIF